MRIGTCTRCRRKRIWINKVDRPLGEWCADCFDAARPAKRPQPGRGSGPNSNDPGFDNVVRAYEEDR